MAERLPDRWTDYLVWKQQQHERPLPKSAGVWCKDCRYSHPYNGPKKCGVKFEKRSAGWVTMWLCPRTGLVIGEYGRGTIIASG